MKYISLISILVMVMRGSYACGQISDTTRIGGQSAAEINFIMQAACFINMRASLIDTIRNDRRTYTLNKTDVEYLFGKPQETQLDERGLLMVYDILDNNRNLRIIIDTASGRVKYLGIVRNN